MTDSGHLARPAAAPTGLGARSAVALAGGLIALGLPLVSTAIEWGAEPTIGVGTEYNDNIFLTTQMHESVWGFTLTPTLDLSARQEAWELRSSTLLTDRHYVNRSDLDADNLITILTYSYRTERNQLQLKGSYSNEAAWATTAITDIGLVQTGATRRATALAEPTWNWYLTERIQLNVDYQWTAISYQNGLSNNLLDYQQQTPSLTLSDQITPRTSLTASLAYAEFEVTTPQDEIFAHEGQTLSFPTYTSKSRSSYAQIGISHDFTETLKGSLTGGPRKTVADMAFPNIPICDPSCHFFEEASTTHGSVFSGRLESSLELTHTTLNISRTVDASGYGSQVQVGNIDLRIDRQITQDRLSAWFDVSGYLFTGLTTGVANQDRHYYLLTPGLHWRWTEYLSLDASYRYQYQRYVGQSDYVTANAFFVSLTYRWPKFSVSR